MPRFKLGHAGKGFMDTLLPIVKEKTKAKSEAAAKLLEYQREMDKMEREHEQELETLKLEAEQEKRKQEYEKELDQKYPSAADLQKNMVTQELAQILNLQNKQGALGKTASEKILPGLPSGNIAGIPMPDPLADYRQRQASRIQGARQQLDVARQRAGAAQSNLDLMSGLGFGGLKQPEAEVSGAFQAAIEDARAKVESGELTANEAYMMFLGANLNSRERSIVDRMFFPGKPDSPLQQKYMQRLNRNNAFSQY